MLDHLKEKMNVAYTENGAKVYATTKSDLLDFFALGGALRNRSESDIVQLFSRAFAEDKLLALKSAFYFRDIRGGQGERRTFRAILKYLANNYPDIVRKNLHLIPEYGRWDDVYVLVGTPVEKDVANLIRNQFVSDMTSKYPSLMAKWLKSENASSAETKRLARWTRKVLGLSSRDYRKALTELRTKIKIVEQKMSANQWSEIEYDKLPSKAGMKYRQAFLRHDEERYRAFIEAVKSGKKKMNAKTLYPYEIVAKVPYNPRQPVDDETLDAMWKSLPDYVGERNERSIVVADTSGSMWGTPMDVAVSLAIYFAERNKGEFANHFITFSARPQLQEIKGDTISEKVRNLRNAEWGMNTNIEAVFDLILDTAVEHGLSQDEMIDKIYIISDMQFDQCVNGGRNKRLFEEIRERYESHGYKLPQLVFWNVDARQNNFPMSMTETGVQLVSGFSPMLFEHLVSGISAYELMLKILNSERYSAITI
jgi:hypothetical protein